jgi:GT2 family glycosyltransferase
MKKTAVVILNWNGRKLLEQFLPSVAEYTSREDIEIVVADNYSTDNSVDFLEKKYPAVKLILLDKNYGFAEGYNRALSQLEADYFVLLNSDVEVTEDWLYPLIDYLDENKEVVAVQPKILAQRSKEKFEYAGAAGGFLDKYGYPFCRGRIFGVVEEDKGQYDVIRDIFWASGACMLIRSKAYFDCGGLDASFFAHMEEIDLCWRLWSRGHKLVCLPSSVVYHVGGATLNEESPHKTFLNFRNNLLMLYKNLPEHSLKSILRVRWFLDYLAALHLVLKGKFSNAKAVIRAYKEFKRIKFDYNTARSENLKKTIVSNIGVMYTKSILAGFYFKGKKIFSKIDF